MNNQKISAPQIPSSAVAIGPKRYQVYRDDMTGNRIVVQFFRDEAEAVGAFMQPAPVFYGGDIHLFDAQEQRVAAFVKWRMMTTELGLRIHYRVNVFHDWHLALLACQSRNSDLSNDALPTSWHARTITKYLHSSEW